MELYVVQITKPEQKSQTADLSPPMGNIATRRSDRPIRCSESEADKTNIARSNRSLSNVEGRMTKRAIAQPPVLVAPPDPPELPPKSHAASNASDWAWHSGGTSSCSSVEQSRAIAQAKSSSYALPHAADCIVE